MKAVRPAGLNITAAPFRSSNLAIPPSPFSPRLPLTPPPSTVSKPRHASAHASPPTARLRHPPSIPPPPTAPQAWVWQCHVCRIRYPLGVTRRCLEDGHHFCSGTAVVRTKRGKGGQRSRVVRRHQACSSEFDYQCWSAWGAWRGAELRARELRAHVLGCEREAESLGAHTLGLYGQDADRDPRSRMPRLAVPAVAGEKDCWNRCNYPSECRWGAQRQWQQQQRQQSPCTTVTPTALSPSPADTVSGSGTMSAEPSTVLETVPMDVDVPEVVTTVDGILENMDDTPPQVPAIAPCARTKESSGSAVKAIFGALRLSQHSRRKTVQVGSPLAHEAGAEGSRTDSPVEPSAHARTGRRRRMEGERDLYLAGSEHSMSRVSLFESSTAAGRLSDEELILSMTSPSSLPRSKSWYGQDPESRGGQCLLVKERRTSKKGYSRSAETLRVVNKV